MVNSAKSQKYFVVSYDALSRLANAREDDIIAAMLECAKYQITETEYCHMELNQDKYRCPKCEIIETKYQAIHIHIGDEAVDGFYCSMCAARAFAANFPKMEKITDNSCGSVD